MPRIVSTLSSSNEYVSYHKFDDENSKVGRTSVPVKSVLIKGGANVAGAIRTLDGVVTHVSDDELAHLKTVRQFSDHVNNGFLTILDSDREVDESKVSRIVKDMKDRDDSSQLEVEKGDFEKGGRGNPDGKGIAPKSAKGE
jgi:hypothetical protein